MSENNPRIIELLDEQKSLHEKLSSPEMMQTVELLKTELPEEVRKAWYNAAAILTAVSNAYSQIDIGRIQSVLISIGKQISEIHNQFFFPSINEERRKALEESNEQWGRLGWTLPFNAPLRYFDVPPDTNIKEAHKRIMVFFKTKEDITNLHKCIRRYYPNNSDFESAVFCFENRQYMACALLLFALIDSKLIGIQDKSTHLKTGMGAIKNLEIEKQKLENEGALIFCLHSINLFSCLMEMFQNTKDFTTKPQVINRNYLAHGMSKKRVLRRDCIQLFLVLANLSFFIKRVDLISSKRQK